MSPTLVIFRKDVRHLWPHIILWISVLVSSTIADPWADAYGLPLRTLAAAYLIVTVVQQEALPGDRQYWRTRPFHWHAIFRAKSLFILVFVNGAALLTHAAVLAGYGIPVVEHLPTLLRTQLFLTLLILLPAAVLGALTSNLSQTMLFAFFGLVALVFVSSPIAQALAAGQGWIGTPIAIDLVAGSVIAILVLQYWQRRTLVARIVFLTVALAGSIQLKRVAPPRPPFQHITLDPTTARTLPNRSAVELRIHIDGIPVGVEPIITSVRLIQISKYDHRLQTLEAAIHDFVDGAGWLTIYDSQKMFRSPDYGAVVTGYTGDLNIVLFDQTRTFPVPLDRPVVIPGIGPCSRKKAEYGLFNIVCVSPWPRASLAIQSPGAAKQWIVEQLAFDSTLPTPRTLTPLHKFSTSLLLRPDELAASRLISGQLLGGRHLTFTLPNLPLIPQQ